MASNATFEIPAELAAVLSVLREQGRHPLVAAARAGDLEALLRELPAADADYRGLALEEAAAKGASDVIEALLAAEVPLTNAPLQRAIFAGHHDVLTRLLAAHPPDDAVAPAFISAVLEDDHASVDVFIDAGRVPEHARGIVLRFGSDGMRKRWGIRARRRR